MRYSMYEIEKQCQNMSVIDFFHKFNTFNTFTMYKSLNRRFPQFDLNQLNNFQENQIHQKLSLKPKIRKKPNFNLHLHSEHSAEIKYADDILKHAFTVVSYPQIIKGPQKIKRDVQSLLHEVTSVNGHNFLWHEKFLSFDKKSDSFFCNPQITLQKRVALVEWIISVHQKYTLKQQTLHLTIKLLDDHCMKNHVPLGRYQLMGVAALFMAAKYEQNELPRIKDYSRLIVGNYTTQNMISAEAQILCKCQFLLTRKISINWYMQAFGIKEIIFGRRVKYSRRRNQETQSNKQNSDSISSIHEQPQQNRFEKLMSFCQYVLNLLILEYKITKKHKEDIIAISTLIFGTFQKKFADADSKALMKYFSNTKQRLIEGNESSQQICKEIKKCIKKIEGIYSKRFDKRFNSVNEKFSMKETKYQ